MNVQRIATLGLILLLTHSALAADARELRFPNLKDGRLVLSVDTHTHSVFSDGHVWPTVRVWEANKDRLDGMAITEHLEYQPYRKDIPHPDRNRAFELAAKENKKGRDRTDLLLIPGAEITRKYSPGHVNAIFINDANPLLTTKNRREETYENAREALREAKAQQAFMIWNHPAWQNDFPDGVIKISKDQQALFDEGLIHGIEVANGEYFNDSSLQVALDHDLTIIGASDIHGLIDYDYDISKGTHRTVTLVFAEERSVKGIAQALFQKHTVALYDRQFIGRDAELGALFNSFVSFERLPSRRKDRQQTTVRISNTGPIAIELKVAGHVSLNKSVGYITVPAAGSAIITVLDRAANDPIDLELVWVNSWKAPKAHVSVQISL
jgi:histidinol phosphatase-like PHP family hydrolase